MKAIFTDAEAGILYEAQGILSRYLDSVEGVYRLSRDAQVAETAERALRDIVNRDADRAREATK